MSDNKKIQFFLRNILEDIEEIEKYVQGIDQEGFKQDSKTQAAVAKKLENIGEAAGQLPQDFKNNNSHVPWQDAADMRNFLIHEYFGIDSNEIWSTAVNDLPGFKKNIQELLEKYH
jgi:uncharacterized protein with HEPN domain